MHTSQEKVYNFTRDGTSHGEWDGIYQRDARWRKQYKICENIKFSRTVFENWALPPIYLSFWYFLIYLEPRYLLHGWKRLSLSSYFRFWCGKDYQLGYERRWNNWDSNLLLWVCLKKFTNSWTGLKLDYSHRCCSYWTFVSCRINEEKLYFPFRHLQIENVCMLCCESANISIISLGNSQKIFRRLNCQKNQFFRWTDSRTFAVIL